jgi:polysaccharide export outer membrane protein
VDEEDEMKGGSWKVLIATAIAASSVACASGRGDETPDTSAMDATLAASTEAALASTSRPIGAEDLLEVTVFEAPELSRAVRVAGDGTISLPVLGSVQAAGLAPTELATAVEGRLRGTYMVDPHVAVELKEARSRPVYVLGAVKKPGAIPLDGSERLTVLRALALGEGLQSNASGGRAFIIRNAGDRRLEIPVDIDQVIAGKNLDPVLEPNDIVYVPNSPVKSLAKGVAETLARVVGRVGIF